MNLYSFLHNDLDFLSAFEAVALELHTKKNFNTSYDPKIDKYTNINNFFSEDIVIYAVFFDILRKNIEELSIENKIVSAKPRVEKRGANNVPFFSNNSFFSSMEKMPFSGG